MSAYTSETTIHELVSDYKARIAGKVILTTGVTPGGLGATFVEAIAAGSPSLLILAGRSASKVSATAQTIAKLNPNVKTKTLIVDLGSMKSVRAAAEQVNSWTDVPKIDVLVNNAAVMATEYQLTEDGFEAQFATCHLGHFLFTNLIMGKLLKAEGARVVNVSSSGHRLGHIRFGDPHFDNGQTYQKWVAYGQAKTANMLFSISLAEKLGKKGLRSYSLHPGVIMGTGLAGHLNPAEEGDFHLLTQTDRQQGHAEGWGEFKFINNETGAATHAFAAFDPSLETANGAYLLESRIADPYVDTVKPWATDRVEADRLWKLSEELLGQMFEY